MDLKTRWSEFKKSMQPTIRETKFMIKRIRQSPLSLVGVGIIVFFVLLAVLAPVLAPPSGRDPFIIPRDWELWRVHTPPVPPTWEHPFGTTQWQFDVYYACIWGTITAFRVGLLVVAASLVLGLLLGITAGYYGGIIDEALMRFTDIIIAFPGLILAMALVIAIPSMYAFNLSAIFAIALGIMMPLAIIFKPDRRLLIIIYALFALSIYSYLNAPLMWTISMNNLDKVMIAMVLVGWPGYSRVIRGEVLRVKNEDYIEAAKAAGCSDLRIILKHVLPNAIYPVVIMSSLDTGAVVLGAAALSFLGLGAPDDYADWGQIINRSRAWILSGTDPLSTVHTFLIPGIFIFAFVMGWNLLGDAARDILDPTLRRR